jgi:hypothetical protein
MLKFEYKTRLPKSDPNCKLKIILTEDEYTTILINKNVR